jgi:N-acyl-L-homoserine lactone synthetase
MIECVNLRTAHLFGDVLPSLHRLRYRIFVERQQWNVPNYDGMEYDQYDTPATTYLVWRDRTGEARGVARLNPTNRPYMLQELWPEAVETQPLPNSAHVFEGTRFGVDRGLEPAMRDRVISELLCGCLEYGLRNSLNYYVVLMPVVVLKGTFMRAGCAVEFLGEHRWIGEEYCAAARCEVDASILNRVRAKKRIEGPVLVTAEDLLERKAA